MTVSIKSLAAIQEQQLTESSGSLRASRLQLVSTSHAVALFVSDALALLIAALTAFLITGWVQQNLWGTPTYVMQHSWLSRSNIYLAICIGIFAALWNSGLYTARLPWWSKVQTIFKIVMVAFLVDGFISFAMKSQASRLLIILNWMFAGILLLAFRYALYTLLSRMKKWQIPAVIMADNDMATDIMMAFHNEPCNGYKVHTIVLRDDNWRKFDRGALPAKERNVRLLVGVTNCASYVMNHPNNYYIISMDVFSGEARDQLMYTLDKVKAQYALVPSLSLSGAHGTKPHYYFGHDIMLLPSDIVNRRRVSVGRVFKRGMDIVVSGTAVLLLSPLLLLIATMLKIEGQGGTVFYGGKRVGRNGKMFKCWKIRSMEPHSDQLLHDYLESDPLIKARWEKYRKLANDPRVTTRTAAIIRKLSMDELPQLWNVLVGDMSLVGPRPILSEEKHYFGRRLRHYLSVRPGLTGLWQVSGRNNTSFMNRVYWDSWYVRNWSLWHDIIILFKTPIVLIGGKGAS